MLYNVKFSILHFESLKIIITIALN